MGNDLNKDNGILKSKKSRKVEKYLGIAGGICGIIGAIIGYCNFIPCCYFILLI